MRIPLFGALAMSALFAAMASAQAPSNASTAPADFPVADDTARPVYTVPAGDKPATTDWLTKIGWRWREPSADTVLPAANTEAPVARGASRFWVTNEMLTWWIQGMQIPALISTSPQGTPTAQAGVLDANGNTTVYGPTSVDDGVRLGWRLTVGGWFDDDHHLGLEVHFLTMANGGSEFAAFSPNGNPILARPAISVFSRANVAEPISIAGVASGSIRVSTTTSGLLGAGFLLRENFYRSDDPCNTLRLAGADCAASGSSWLTRWDSLLGFRYLRMSDHLEIDDNVLTQVALNGLPAGATMQRVDRFDSHNNFYGADLGISGETRHGAWSLGTIVKMAVGFNNSSVDIYGARNVNGVVTSGGFLAQTTNIGHFGRTDATIIPELDFKLGYFVTPNVQLSVGYSFLYLFHQARAGNQIDPLIDPAFLAQGVPTGATPARPAFSIQERGVWVQGISVGFEWRY